jgi:hypothetical protein
MTGGSSTKEREGFAILPERQALALKTLDQPDRTSKKSPEEFLIYSAGLMMAL